MMSTLESILDTSAGRYGTFILVLSIEKIPVPRYPVFHSILAINLCTFNNTFFGVKNQYPKLDMYIPHVKAALSKQANSYWNT